MVRLGLEGSRRFALGADGPVLTPSFELGLRRDGGDAETGFGADIGAGLALSDPANGLSAELSGRGLLAHSASGFREWGVSAALAWDPAPASALGPSASLRHSRGAASADGADALLARRTLAGLDEDGELPGGAFEAELGYGFSVLGGRAVGTPHAGLASRESGESWRLGYRLGFGQSTELDLGGEFGQEARTLRLGYGYRIGDALDLGLEASRREAANDDAAPEHEVMFRARLRW